MAGCVGGVGWDWVEVCVHLHGGGLQLGGGVCWGGGLGLGACACACACVPWHLGQ